jgi:hypothetical protein
MPKNKVDGKSSIYVGRKPPLNVTLTDNDWLEIQTQSGLHITPELTKLLNEIVQTVAGHGGDTLKLLPLKEINRKVQQWVGKTNKLRAALCGDKKLELPNRAKKASVQALINRYFEPMPHQKAASSSSDLAHALEGAIKLIWQIESQMKPAGVDDLDFWMVWAALIISALRKHKVPFARREKSGKIREQFRADVIDFIYYLQLKLPSISWARKEPASIRKALKWALPMARDFYIPALKNILTHWSAGRLDIFEALSRKRACSPAESKIHMVLDELSEARKFI